MPSLGWNIRTSGRRWLAFAALPLFVAHAIAQSTDPPGKSNDPLGKEKLRGIETQIEKSGFEQRRLTYEIENLSTEAQKLRLALIDVAKKVREAEERLAVQEEKLASLGKREEALRQSLRSRERVLAEVLAAMQRIGRKPPPALLVAPEDVLSAMRAAILLGTVLPDMRDEAMILVADLNTLTDLRRETAVVTEQMRAERSGLDGEWTRMAALVAERQNQISLSREQLDREKARVASLSQEAKSLRDLISRSENEIVGNARAVEIAKRAPVPAKGGTNVASLNGDAGRNVARLQPRIAFAERRGHVPLPVSGQITRLFGQPDGVGGTERGITISSNRSAVVTAPGDAWVHFAGPYRGYGHLVILNAGNGYHVVLAGMERLSVEIGQFVLAGEPLGFMAGKGEGASAPGQTGVNVANGNANPLGGARPALYVEFRKDGSPFDPSSWWSQQSAEKARG
ncbi:MAG TPA: peptidoglycan DD-metalloendopeptidase family protein [Rhabdaerophilum sp.]|nr:peptidoglycan DD-metalloendopeptidase family protein [Rhabdaerophilum sp.]